MKLFIGAVKDFIVVDTEGSEELSEIAIINAQGQLIYEAFDPLHANNTGVKLKNKPLRQIVLDFFDLAEGKYVVCHHANHDIEVLQRSCQKSNLTWKRSLQFQCTYELAQKYVPNLPSYSLAYLSQKFNLKVNQRYFNFRNAHRARYDAEFTYQLYLKIMDFQLQQTLQNKLNPFSSSKVDNPFQEHPDLKQVFQDEFAVLKATIEDIKLDYNHQSQGAVIIGEPGSGKTHLIMRLAKELLQVNRLLFIGQPNNPDTVLYHIYTRILKSFVETVPGNGYTQLENLLAHSFFNIINAGSNDNQTRNDQVILSLVANNPLNLYNLAAEGTDRKRLLWQHIERRTREWWTGKYGLSGFSTQIIKGIIKFCSYTDPRRKELATRWLVAHDLEPEDVELVGLGNWSNDLSKEEFSLEAISVFSKLSLLDEPLIIVFDQLEGLGLQYNQPLLERFGEAIKEIFTYVPNSLIILNLFPDRWQQFQSFFDGSVVDRISQHRIFLHRPNQEQLRKILHLKARSIGVELDNLFTLTELQEILSQPSIRSVLNRAADYYRYKVRHIPMPPIPGNATPAISAQTASVEQRLDRLEQEFGKIQQAIQAIATALNMIGSTPPSATATSDFPNTSDPPAIERGVQEQVVEYWQIQRQRLEEDYERLQIITDSEDLGKLMTIAEAFKLTQEFEIDCLRLGRRRLPEHRVFRSNSAVLAIGFLQVDGGQFTNLLKNFNELVITHKEIEFLLWRDVRESRIKGKVGLAEIEKLNNTSNGRFQLMEKDDRMNFELMYKLVVDIQNYDLDVDLVTALQVLKTQFDQSWLIQTMQKLD